MISLSINPTTVAIINERHWKYLCGKSMVVVLSEHGPGQYLRINIPYSAAAAEELRRKHGGELKEIVNERFIQEEDKTADARIAAAGLVETLESALAQLEIEKGGLLVEWRARIHQRGQAALSTWDKFLEVNNGTHT